MRLKSLMTFLLLTLVLSVAACAPATPVLPPSGSGTTPGADGGATIPETGADAAQMEEQVRNNVTQFLTSQLNAAAGAVQAISLTEVDWPDACLGVPRENENCAQVVTPGWRVSATIEGQQYVLRTNRDASVVRFDIGSQGGVDVQQTTPGTGQDDMDEQQTTPVPDTGQDQQQTAPAPGTGTGDQGAGQGANQTATVQPGDTDEGGVGDQDGAGTGTGDTGTGDQGGTGTGTGDTGTGDQSGPGAAQPTMDTRPPADQGGEGDTGGEGQGDTGDQGATGAVPTTGGIQLFLVRAAGTGAATDQAGQSFGTCGDTLVGVPANIQDSGDLADNVRRTYQALLNWNQESFEGMNLTSGLANSEDLRVESVTVGSNGRAFVRLSGNLNVQGNCDPDRVLNQLRQAGLQFEGVNEVEIFLNDQELDTYLTGTQNQNQ